MRINQINVPVIFCSSAAKPASELEGDMHYEPGDEFQSLSIPVTVNKLYVQDPATGGEVLKSGFSIAGGIDQDYTKSPQKFTEAGVYITRVDANGAAARAGLRPGDRILQCNGHDFTLVTHKKAVDYIKKYPVLEMLVLRKDDVSV